MNSRVSAALWASSLLLSGCSLAPDYAPPQIQLPTQYKEDGAWKAGEPKDDRPRGDWWRVFNDRVLNELEPQVEAANQDFTGALASMERARAFVAKAEAGLLPLIQSEGGLSSNKQSAHRPLRKANTPPSNQGLIETILSDRPLNEPDHFGNNILRLQSSYEIDLWGRVRNAIAAGKAEAEARTADIYSLQLSLEAELARDYIALRGLDAESRLLTHTESVYQEALALTKARYAGEIASAADVPRAEAQLASVRAQRADLSTRRAAFEHAIAALIGKPASNVTIPIATQSMLFPKMPAVLPSTLLERRSDIAAAERRVAAANESIGIARAAFFPRLTINISGGVQDTGLNLLNVRNSIWSVGPAITLPIFDGGARLADLSVAESAYAETVAQYKSTVLRAIQEVEDDLSSLHWLRTEAVNIDRATEADRKVLDVSLNLYREGAVTYLDVVSAQTALLDAQRSGLSLKTRRLQSSVALTMALGGGWDARVYEGALQ
jgi:outer membrane protein, multidrug efflux system